MVRIQQYHLGYLAPPYVFCPWSASLPKGFLDLAPWLILEAIVYTWIFNNTRGNVLTAVLLHAMMNTRIFWCCGSSEWHSYGTLLIVIVLIVVFFGAKNLMRQKPVEGT